MVKSVNTLTAILALTAIGLSGCATATAVHAPRNYITDINQNLPAELQQITTKSDENIDLARALNRTRCQEPLLPTSSFGNQPSAYNNNILSIGDILKIEIEDGEEFSGLVEINVDGTIDLPYLTPLSAAGKSLEALENFIAHRLVKDGYFRRGFAIVSAGLVQTGARRISVSGAVFQAGVFSINERKADDISANEQEAYGEGAYGTTVATALKRAAGIRPDADIANVVLIRNGNRRVLDMSGAFSGKAIENPPVLSGDQIIVPSRGCFQETLARASAVTTPGVRLYMSNLTQPATSNAQSAIGRDSINFPYGARLLQAIVSANCVGGIHVTNANRYVVYMTKDWDSGRTIVVERPVEALVRRADRDNFNPFLQEGDALACYDSAVTNARDVIRMIGEVASPAIFTRGLIGS